MFNLKKMGKVNTSIGQTLAVKPGLPTLTPSLVLNPTLTPRAPTLSQTLSPPSSPHVPNQVDQDTVDLLKQQFIALDALLQEQSVRRAAELAEDPEVLRLLNREDVFHVVLRQSRQGQDLLETLFMKYAKEALTSLPAALLLDGEGKRLRAMHLEGAGPANQWLGEWLGTRRPPAP